MNKSISFRDFDEADYDGLMTLWERTGLSSRVRQDDLETIKRSLEIGGKLIIMEDGNSGKMIGSSWMTFDGRRIHLHHFGIDPEFQGMKLARKLLYRSLQFVKEKGVQVKLEVHEKNIKAVNLYWNNHFEYLGDYRIYIIRDLSVLGEEIYWEEDTLS